MIRSSAGAVTFVCHNKLVALDPNCLERNQQLVALLQKMSSDHVGHVHLAARLCGSMSLPTYFRVMAEGRTSRMRV